MKTLAFNREQLGFDSQLSRWTSLCCHSDNTCSFPLQYITLMLIILTFLIGSFTGASRFDYRRSEAKANEFKPLEGSAKVRSPLAHITFKSLHRQWRLNQEGHELAALTSFLQSHDVTMNLALYVSGESGDKSLEGEIIPAVMLVSSLVRYLEKAGVPTSAIKVRAIFRRERDEIQAQAWFFKETEGEL